MSSTKIQPQGPKGYPFVGNLFDLASPKRLEWLQSLVDQYGDVVSFRLLKQDIYLVNHPELVKDRETTLALLDADKLDLADFWDVGKQVAESFGHIAYQHCGSSLP